MDFINQFLPFNEKSSSTPLLDFKLPIQTIDSYYDISENIINEMELTNGDNSMYHKIFDMKTPFEKLNTNALAKYYTDDTTFLKDNQTFLSLKVPKPIDDQSVLDIIELRKDIADETGFVEKYHFVEWDQLKFLNNNSTFMKYLSLYEIASPLITLALPIFMLIMPFFIIRLQGNAINFSKYVEVLKVVLSRHSIGQIFSIGSASWDKRVYIIISFLFYLAQVYWNYQSCIKFIKNFKIIHEKLDTIKNYLNKSVIIMSNTINNIKQSGITTFNKWYLQVETCRDYMNNLIESYNQFTPYGLSIGKIREIGYLMQNFYKLYNDEYLISIIDYSIKFNSYIKNISCFQNRIDNKQVEKCSFTKKKTQMKKAYYPILLDEPFVANDIHLDKNIIITGPNAAGKTTFIKTAMINILLSQQLGFGFYKKAKIHCYQDLQCYINIPDTSGRDSLFQAEARRCKMILDNNKHNDKHRFCIFDELFSGTNPYEAIGAATGFLKYLNTYNNITFVITTHFLDLCKKMDEDKKIINLNMEIVNVNDDFKYTYKVIPGISNVKGGIKVLKDLDFPKEIIDTATAVIDKLNI
uniref:DNA mismatch repair proteins mutS family domain-containing protein n=1 Tax=viral metagenome TaxID=1070528 RepID=A0A6C0CQZ2_9ZZZZ